ncbi:MAG TPA: hypothetical protein VGQ00_01740 [Candidatus Norongarragalinales archaeon]|jgi:hypothetical protein|nr:hypothetical protein [Candidatus Norongarragalinales archaeon]
MKRSILAGLFVFVLLVVPFASADVLTATSTKVFFEKDGKPYSGPASFTVTCYGRTYYPGRPAPPEAVPPQEVFSFSANVTHYGDAIDENYYLNYRIIDFCNMKGEAGGTPFEILHYGDAPIALTICKYNGPTDSSRNCAIVIDVTGKTVKTIDPDTAPAPMPAESKFQTFLSSLICLFKRIFGLPC